MKPKINHFETLEALINHVANLAHEANLNYGGVFDKDGNRHADLEVEKRWTRKKLQYTDNNYAEVVYGILTEKYPAKLGYNYIQTSSQVFFSPVNTSAEHFRNVQP